ncbi:hypothetical protein [Streptomyces sp. NBC_01451]|nr:hypothetical protein [Streptomyces sp. NBC_01451]
MSSADSASDSAFDAALISSSLDADAPDPPDAFCVYQAGVA